MQWEMPECWVGSKRYFLQLLKELEKVHNLPCSEMEPGQQIKGPKNMSISKKPLSPTVWKHQRSQKYHYKTILLRPLTFKLLWNGCFSLFKPEGFKQVLIQAAFCAWYRSVKRRKIWKGRVTRYLVLPTTD